MLELIAERGCGYVLMHIEGPPRVDRDRAGLRRRRRAPGASGSPSGSSARAELGVDAGADRARPGLDFDLSTDDDLEILRRLGELRELGRPLFVALSRKDFLGAIAAGSWEERLDAGERGPATLAATALAVAEGAEMLRLHDVEALDAMRTAAAIAGVRDVTELARRAAARLGAPARGGRGRRAPRRRPASTSRASRSTVAAAGRTSRRR